MKSELDLNGLYDVIDPEGLKVGEIKKGLYYEGGWQTGRVQGQDFVYNGQVAGNLDGLTLTRTYPLGPPATIFQLVLKKQSGETLE
jgi:hypothetical protein